MNKYIKRLIIVNIIVLILVAVICIYLNDTYTATNEAIAICENNQCLTDMVVFEPAQEIKAGLIFYPGAKVDYKAYAPLMQKLADEGILCIAVHMPANLAFLDINKANQLIDEYPKIKEWYICGHSLGGVAAGKEVSDNQKNYKGLILLASFITTDISDSDTKVLSVYCTKDGVLNMEKYEKNKANLPSGMVEKIIVGGNHAQFGNYGSQERDNDATISANQQQEETVKAIVDFIYEF